VRPHDTAEAAHVTHLSWYKRLSPGARVALAASMSDDARTVARAGIRARHPEYTDEQVSRALMRLLFGDDVCRRAWPGDGPAVSAGDALGRVVSYLEQAGIPHMIAGSFASAYHGVPRATQDIDIVIDPSPAALEALLAHLPASDYYVDPDAARDALRQKSQFNVIDMVTGWKVDFLIRKARPFSQEEFNRRQAAELFGTSVFVSTAEDSILAKLEWAKLGDSERQLRDVDGILAVRGESLDLEYVNRWVAALNLSEQWSRVRPPQR
jgi:hypothetical protein